MEELNLDPVGYFVIRVRDKKIEVGFCKYQDIQKKGGFAKNKIEDIILSDSEEEIMEWIDSNDYISVKHHEEYMKKQIKKAQKAIKNNTRYVQD